ncbi:hypothetical protein ACG0Z6_09875 [Roseateles sp. BYS180W]|uniref:DUF4198 domain-containing protein n=1 Tax=Roseateles rivi TaxID=3299028 RepID=A0ABW7FW54_9BURK
MIVNKRLQSISKQSGTPCIYCELFAFTKCMQGVKLKALTVLAGLLAAPAVWAHSLWIEPHPTGALHVLYGEPEVRVQERSPGKLDTLEFVTGPTAWRKASAGFALHDVTGDSNQWVHARAAHVRVNASNPGGAQAMYYARRAVWPLKATSATLTLDIVPSAEPNTVAVYFKGTPMKGGTLKVIAPSLWLQVHDIDERGLVRIHAPWAGLYVLEVDTHERRSGELAGRRFEVVTHRATLSFTKADGSVFEAPLTPQFKAH